MIERYTHTSTQVTDDTANQCNIYTRVCAFELLKNLCVDFSRRVDSYNLLFVEIGYTLRKI